ncbi:MAG: VIT1/CCC1 transporter family protein, partial [bacterium]
KKIIQDEENHEASLTDMLQEERLQYIGSIVLGLNDALVELTGALAGLTLAFQNSRLIILSASVTGFAAALSMGASGYLSTKAEENTKDPFRASLYTGITYLITVLILILPFLILKNIFLCLACSIFFAIAIIAFYNYYVSVANEVSFKDRFLEMAILSLGVAGISFGIGLVLRSFLGVEV